MIKTGKRMRVIRLIWREAIPGPQRRGTGGTVIVRWAVIVLNGRCEKQLQILRLRLPHDCVAIMGPQARFAQDDRLFLLGTLEGALALDIFPEGVGQFGAEFVDHAAGGAFGFFHEAVQVVAGA